jgi:hypothetical protein
LVQLFGFSINRTDKDIEKKEISFAPEVKQDGALEVSGIIGGSYGTFVDFEGTSRNEANLVNKYRTMSMQPECDIAIDDVVNEAIVVDAVDKIVELNLTDLDVPDNIKKRIIEEFEYIIKMLEFENEGYDIFRRWYIDGRLYYHKVVDVDNPGDGIKELRYIDPRKITKIRKAKTRTDPATGVVTYLKPDEFYIFNRKGISINNTEGVKIASDSITHISSGIVDPKTNMVLGYLHKAIKPLNQLRTLEDASVIYRLARAPERRIFYIDVGNLPKIKAEQYLHSMMVKHKNRLVYDAVTGEVKDDRKFMTMLEDFWLPRREGGRGTEITTLPGGENLGEMTDVEYFNKKLLRALNVPISRMESDSVFNIGRGTEITRDEIKFSKFIIRLRNKFSKLFDDMLQTQLILKNIIKSRKEWEDYRPTIKYDFNFDNHFSELKATEILHERMNLTNDIDPFVGKYFSIEWVRSNVLRHTEDEIKEIDNQIKKEAKDQGDQFDIGGPGEKGGVAPHIHPDAQQEPDDTRDQNVKLSDELDKSMTALVE